jgi:hypothetical protein
MEVTDDTKHLPVELAVVRASERAVASVVDVLAPDDVALADVTEMWQAFDHIERLAVNAKALLAARVETSGAWRTAGARSAAEHLAKMSRSSTSAARRSLESSKRLGALPRITDALRGGVLSSAQVDAISEAAAADPMAEDRLLWMAETSNVTELREECLRTKAAADPDRDATYARIHTQRRLRTFTDPEGGWNLIARGTADMGSRFESALRPILDEMFTRARAEGRRELREAYAVDALIVLAEREAAPTPDENVKKSAEKPRYFGLLHMTFEALVRGAIEGEEVCEIVGLGPIPVRIARELLGESILKLVITKGTDVVNVTHLGRGATAAQRVAVLWTKPKCANIECSSMFVQLDHRVPWATTKHTRLDELDPLCLHDHALKTNHGWALEDGSGRRALVGPDDPRHPRNKPPP